MTYEVGGPFDKAGGFLLGSLTFNASPGPGVHHPPLSSYTDYGGWELSVA
jgi:hypothetical protein